MPSFWILFVSVCLGIFAYGATLPSTIHILAFFFLVCLVARCMEHVICRTKPSVPVIPVLLSCLILLYGWFHVWNASGVFDPGFWQSIPRSQPIPSLPGAFDYQSAKQWMWRLTGLFAAFWVTLDLASHSKHRRSLSRSLAAIIALMALLGIVQRASGAEGLLWMEPELGPFFFGPYVYHANAGAVLNLLWPLVALCFCLSVPQRKHPVLRAMWTTAFFVTTIALFVHASRAASFLAIFLILAWVFWNRRWISNLIAPFPATVRITGLVLLIVFSIAGLYGTLFEHKTKDRWLLLASQLTKENQRIIATSVCLDMIPDAGAFGTGPGTFRWKFPFYTTHLGGQIKGFWEYAHQDYLQTVIEWGWVGTIMWSALFFGAIFRAYRLALLPPGVLPRDDRYLMRAIALGLTTVALHSLVDFPLQIFSIQLVTIILCALAWGFRVKSNGL